MRDRLVARLASATEPVISVRAPAGYGKSTALSQWAGRDGRPFAWLSLGRSDDDPVVLGSSLTAAIADVQPMTTALHPVLTGQEPGFASIVLPALGQQLHAASTPFVLVVDDVQLITDPAAVRMLLLVVSAVPAGSQVVLVSRADPPVPLARLRADGRLLEVGVDELAMDRREARIMLAGTGLRADAGDAVVAASEGWPAGLQLAGLAMRSAHPQRPAGDGDPQPGAVAVSGGERIVVDYLRSEVWSALDEVTLSFLTRTSVLDELTGPLCDAVLDTSGSGTMLRELRCSNQMLLPMDSRDDRYRHHHLVLDALRSELLRRESSLIPELHRRASSWFEQHGDIGSAISHATRGGDLARTAGLVWANVGLMLGSGPRDTLSRWLDGIGDRDIAASSELSAASAWGAMLAGNQVATDRWILIADAHARVGTDDSGAAGGRRREVRASLALLRALRGDAGFDGIGEPATAALEDLSPISPWRPLAGFMIGVGCILTGAPDLAVGHLLAAESLAAGIGGHVARSDCLITLGLLALQEGQWEEGAALVGRAREVIAASGIEGLATSGYPLSVLASVQARGGDTPGARRSLALARELARQSPTFATWSQVLGRTLQGVASLHLNDVPAARVVIREARERYDEGAPSDFLRGFLERAEHALADLPADPSIGSALTTAELRVLQHLPTQLSFPEIADGLFVSRHTIKSQALAIYHKLGVSSRTGAVERARILGLLPGLPGGRG